MNFLLNFFCVCVFVVESVLLVHDFGNVFEHVHSAAVSDDATTLLEAVLMFIRYYEQSEHFYLLTHGMGPGLVAIVMHNFSAFMGNLIGQKINHNATYHGKRLFPNMYMEKLRKIVNSIVVDKTDDYTGKMLKEQQLEKEKEKEKKEKYMHKKKKAVPPAQKKHQTKVPADDELGSDDIEVLSDDSCSSNENDFTTLTSSHGQAYHPPSRVTSKSCYSKKSDDDDIICRIEQIRKTLERQKKQITKLTSENNEAKEKLKNIHSRDRCPLERLKKTSLKAFTSTDLGSVLAESSDDAENYPKQPDSTQPPVHKDHGTTGSDAGSVFNKDLGATGSDAGSIFQCSGVVRKKKKRQRIDSRESEPPFIPPSAKNMSDDNSENEVERLLKTKAEMEVKLKEAQKKLMEQRMDNKARQF